MNALEGLNLDDLKDTLKDLKLDESVRDLDLGSSLPKIEQRKWDKKHRYGVFVICNGCGKSNVTLYNVGNKKLCKNCKEKERDRK